MLTVSLCSSSVSVQKPVITSGRYGALGYYPADSINPVDIPIAVVSAVHHIQYPAVAALHRQVYVVANIIVFGNGV
jgi:hypothetical protein